jgi:hypothetical protein
MATEKEIYISINGTQQAIKSLDDLNKATKQLAEGFEEAGDAADDAAKKTEEAGKETGFLQDRYAGLKDTVGKLKADFKLATKGIKTFFTTGTTGAKALKIAFASTGIGLLVVAIVSLIDYFKDTEEGSRYLQVAFESVGVIVNMLIDGIANLGGKLIEAFTNPVETIKNFANTLKDFVIDRVKQIINGIGLLGTAIMKVFEGDFSGAADAAGEALNELFMVDEIAGAVEAAGEIIVDTFNQVADSVVGAVTAVNNLVIAQRALRDLQQELVVNNAQLTKELEVNQKVAEDTTLAYDERAAALEKVNEANIALAKNAADLAAAEESALRQELALADSYEAREELETQLAEAVATRIETETALEVKKQEAAKLSRELEQEELDRQRSIADTLEQLRNETIQDEEEAARKGLELAERQTLQELEQLRATEEEKEAVREQFRILREQQDAEFAAKRKEAKDKEDQEDKDRLQADLDLEKEVQLKKLELTAAAFGALGALAQAFASEDEARAEKNFKIQKALSLAQATVAGTEAVLNAYNTAQKSPITTLFPAYPIVQAGLAGAFAAAQIATIARSKFKGGNPSPSADGAGGGAPAYDPTAAINQRNDQLTGLQDPGASVTPGGTDQQPIRAYVIATEVTSAQEANAQIDNLSTL